MKVCIRCETLFTGSDWACPSCGYAPREGEIVVFDQDSGSREALTERSFRDLRTIEEGSFWFRARNRLIVWALARYFPRAGSFLEVGCGTGFVLKGVRTALPHLEIAGGELGMAGLAVARERVPDVPLYALDAGRLPFANEFDVLGAFDVIEHVDDDEEVLSQFRTALREGGGLLLTVPQHQWLWSAADDYSGHRRRYTRADLSAKLSRAGFRIIRITSFVS